MGLYGSVVPSNLNFGFISTVLLLKSDPSVLFKLTRSLHCLHQFFIFCASEHATWTAVHRDISENHTVPSSANLTFVNTALYMSMMKVLNRIGESTLPWGNPIDVVKEGPVVWSRIPCPSV